MTTLADPNASRFADHALESRGVLCTGLTTATPAYCASQEEIGAFFSKLWGLRGVHEKRWRRIVTGSRIATRFAVTPIEHIPHLTTEQRMKLYAQHAPALAADAAKRALADSDASAHDVTDLIVVTCTGFSAPGVDVDLIERLGLRPSVRRCTIGFMGCFGAITGLRAGLGACAATPQATALVVCVELCSLHLRAADDVQNQIASALFADGAAAVVLQGAAWAAPASSKPRMRLRSAGISRLLPAHRSDMSWRITDAGFAMTLSPRVPTAIESELADFLNELSPRPASVAIHPGGAAILDAAERALPASFSSSVDCSRAVLREFGNMSSPTALFALERIRRDELPLPTTLVAFGPGLTMDAITLEAE